MDPSSASSPDGRALDLVKVLREYDRELPLDFVARILRRDSTEVAKAAKSLIDVVYFDEGSGTLTLVASRRGRARSQAGG